MERRESVAFIAGFDLEEMTFIFPLKKMKDPLMRNESSSILTKDKRFETAANGVSSGTGTGVAPPT